MKNRIFLRGLNLALCGLATALLVACAGAAEDDSASGSGTGGSGAGTVTGAGGDTTSATTTTGAGEDTTSATATTGTGTDTTSTTTTGTGGGTPQGIDMIDDMEDKNNAILAAGGRGGYWYTFNDGTEGTQQPPPDPEGTGENPFTMTVLEPPRGESKVAARSWGSGFTEWGAAFGFDLNSPTGTKAAYDASAYTGVTFWAKIGPGSVNRVLFMISDQSTVPEGGICTKCDNWQKQITLTEEWQQFNIPFADLKQGGWGDPAPTPQIDAAKLYSVSFQFGVDDEFDLYVDDIAFYK